MQKLRRLNFFDRHVVRREGSDVHPEIQRLCVAVACGGPHHLWLGDRNGTVYRLDRQLVLAAPFKLFDRELIDLSFSEERSLLVALGSDQVAGASAASAGSRFLYKVVDCRHDDREPALLVSHRVSPQARGLEPRAVCLGTLFTLQLIAVGLDKGVLQLFRGRDLATERPLPQALSAENDRPVTGVHFMEQQQGKGRRYVLFASSATSVRSWSVLCRGSDGEENHEVRLLNVDYSGGAAERCACVFPTTNALLVAHGDAIFAYDPDEGNMSAMPLEGDKLIITRYKSYFVAVTTELAPGSGSWGGNMPSAMPKQNVIVCLAYPPHMRFLAYSSQFTDVTHVIHGLGSIFVLSRGGADGNTVLFELREKELQEQLDVLLKKRMFEWAAEVGLQGGAPMETICDIYRQHGDALFEKRAYDQALVVYLKTVDLGIPLEPSYIVECYLNAQRIGHVAKYLKRLHERNRAEPEHTALLLKCYTKLKDFSTLEEFLEKTPVSQYDPVVAIEVLETADYYGLAAEVALKVKKHDDYVRISLEHFKTYSKIIHFLKSLPRAEAGRIFMSHGRVLVAHAPNEAVDLVRSLCDLNPEGADGGPTQQDAPLALEDFLAIFIDDVPLLEKFLRSILLRPPGSTPLPPGLAIDRLFTTLLEIFVRTHHQLTEEASKQGAVEVEKDGAALAERREALHMDIMRLIRQHHGEEAIASTLMLCHTYGFVDGFFYAAEHLGRSQLMMSWCFEHHDTKRLLQVCKRCAPVDQSLWVQALSFLASDESADHIEEIGEVLKHIEMSDLMPLLMVIETLSSNSRLSVGVVRQYLQGQFRKLVDSVDASRGKTRQDLQEIDRMQQEIVTLRTQAQVFQNTKCFQCGLTLEVPAVHFFCGHSYHSYCTPADSRCPKCSSEALPKITLKEQREAQSRNTDDFFKYLQGGAGENGVQAMGEWCKFGAFDAGNCAGQVEHFT